MRNMKYTVYGKTFGYDYFVGRGLQPCPSRFLRDGICNPVHHVLNGI